MSMTYVATIVLQVRPSKRPEVISAIRQVMRGLRMTPGCVVCRSLTEADDDSTLMVVSEWNSEEALEELLKSEEFRVLQGMRHPATSIQSAAPRRTERPVMLVFSPINLSANYAKLFSS